MTADAGRFSDDAALGGRLLLRQPLRGHRFGHDSILLAAATPAQPHQHAVELGAGVGAAGLALARRVEGLKVTLVEIEPTLAALAQDNADRNQLAARVRAVCLDVAAPAAAFVAAGLPAGSADCVLMNPPFNAPQNPSPVRSRSSARIGSADTLAAWLHTAARLLAPRGTVALIWRADGLSDVLAALAADFGAIAILPIYSKPHTPAIRIVARAVKSSKAPLSLLPGLILADKSGKSTPQIDAVLRDGVALQFPES